MWQGRVNMGEERETRKPLSKGPEAALCLDRPGSGKAARNRKDDVGWSSRSENPVMGSTYSDLGHRWCDQSVAKDRTLNAKELARVLASRQCLNIFPK